MLANLVCSLIEHKRVKTTLAKAKAARPVAEKMVTLGKSGTLHDRRLVAARLRYNSSRMLKSKAEVAEARKNDLVRILFDEIAPAFKERRGGYTRIIKLHQRQGDAAELAILEWVDLPGAINTAAADATSGNTATQNAPAAAVESKTPGEQK
jgi:large subunit ribosomal protein L17